jgi:hypothetical protein
VAVRDGRIVMQKGYGIRKVGKPQSVDADSISATAFDVFTEYYGIAWQPSQHARKFRSFRSYGHCD